MLVRGGIVAARRLHALYQLGHPERRARWAGFAGAAGVFAARARWVACSARVSRARLLDLTDLEQPLLQKMAREAPGSWEHSRAMANLAEAAAARSAPTRCSRASAPTITTSARPVRPSTSSRTSTPGERIPHEELEPDVSADAIMAHVVEGVRILREGGIPEPVVEFAYTHHGTSVVEYFWHKCLRAGEPEGPHRELFRYPGMKPQTKETAILMLVDSIEAGVAHHRSARAREVRGDGPARHLHQAAAGPARRVGPDASKTCASSSTQLADTLVNMYHHRIRYPWQDAKARGESPAAGARGRRQRRRGLARSGRSARHPPRTDGERNRLRADLTNRQACRDLPLF